MKSFYNSLKFKQLRQPWAQRWRQWPHTLGLPCLLCGGSLHNPSLPEAHLPIETHALLTLANSQSSLCAACVAALPWYLAPKCPQCALPSPNGLVCGACLQHPMAFDHTLCVFRYAFPMDRCLQAFKYAQQLVFGELFTRLSLHALVIRSPSDRASTRGHGALQMSADTPWLAQGCAAVPDVIVAMPMHRARLRARGFNHAVVVANEIAQLTGIPQAPTACQRIIDTPSQAGLDMKIRTQNLRRAFTTTQDWSGQHVLLVDDVMTTGASMHALAKVFKNAGARRVTALVLARTLKMGDSS